MSEMQCQAHAMCHMNQCLCCLATRQALAPAWPLNLAVFCCESEERAHRPIGPLQYLVSGPNKECDVHWIGTWKCLFPSCAPCSDPHALHLSASPISDELWPLLVRRRQEANMQNGEISSGYPQTKRMIRSPPQRTTQTFVC